MNTKRTLFAVLAAGSMMFSVAGAANAAPNARASEVGHCSSFYGQQRERDDISREIASADFPPGAFYSEAAKNRGPENCT